MATRGRASVAMASIWQEGLEKLQHQAAPMQEWAKAPEARPVQELRSGTAALDRLPAGNSTSAKVVEKVRTRQIALQHRAGALSPRRTSASNSHPGETQSSEGQGRDD